MIFVPILPARRSKFLPNGVGCGARWRHTPSDRSVAQRHESEPTFPRGRRLVSSVCRSPVGEVLNRAYDPFVLVLAFLVIPFVELFVLIKVGGQLGVGNTIAVVLLVSIVGAWLVKREGRRALGRIRSQFAAGQLPADEVIDGGLIMFSGALMITPGFVTDLAALLLLVPPVRSIVRRQLKSRYGSKLNVVGSAGPLGADRFGTGPFGTSPFGTDSFGTGPLDTGPLDTRPSGAGPRVGRDGFIDVEAEESR